MEKIIIEIVKSLYGRDKKQVLNYWEKLNSILLEKKNRRKEFHAYISIFYFRPNYWCLSW